MGIIKDLFEEKKLVWEGADYDFYTRICAILKGEGIKVQAFKLNQNVPKCKGDCLSCHAACDDFDENTPFYEKIGSGLSVDALEKPKPYDIYDIYVKISDEQRAKGIIAEQKQLRGGLHIDSDDREMTAEGDSA